MAQREHRKHFRSDKKTELERLQCSEKLCKHEPQDTQTLPPWTLRAAVSVVKIQLSFTTNGFISLLFLRSLTLSDATPFFFKKSNPEEPDNYRPTSILPCFSNFC